MSWYRFAPYVSVGKRRQRAASEVKKLQKKGQVVQPVLVEGRVISKTFWGKAWCQHLESYSDYESRLPRGRTYLRNGSVIDLRISKGKIDALVSGSSIYKVKINIAQIITHKWQHIVQACTGKIDSLIELLQGKFSNAVMEMMTDPRKGLFPHPKEITLNCSCPDWADMCKHVAAVLYGVGVRLDDRPEDLFLLRQVDHIELIAKAGTASLTKAGRNQNERMLEGSDLSTLFGIDMDDLSKNGPKPKKAIPKIKSQKMPKNSAPRTLKKAHLSKDKVAKKPVKKKKRDCTEKIK